MSDEAARTLVTQQRIRNRIFVVVAGAAAMLSSTARIVPGPVPRSITRSRQTPLTWPRASSRLRAGRSRVDRVKYHLSTFVIGLGLRLIARTEVIGAENVPATGGAILASNHLSILDSFYLPIMLPRPIFFAAKSEYFTGNRPSERIIGVFLRAANQLPVDRTEARAAQDMLESALELLKGGALFGIHPEGTRSPDGRLYRGRTGVGWLALHSGVPVIPVAMVGTQRLLPPGGKVPRPGRIEIRIGKPLLFSEYQDQPAGAKQRRLVTDQVIDAIKELSGQEYVPMYASVRKEQLAASTAGSPANGGAGARPGAPAGPVGPVASPISTVSASARVPRTLNAAE